MYRAFQYLTDTHQTNKNVILYDGSYFRDKNDKIDEIVLEFEKIIYSNIEESYRTCEQIDLNEYTIRPSFTAVKQTTV